MEAAAGAQKAALAPTALTLRGRSQGREGFCTTFSFFTPASECCYPPLSRL
ncbi:hypothetical protein BFJ69_g15643 [Fusarium oxysporum]|uniref:Uncharacterized protein n=1 Tax=Fusarium oxysporum TaxID=5507 RepID=A0A420MDJ6_FUSOX|nr:hypothetical protein BFJ69_g15643 [Fusarium oxysporum]